jgi:hypothetical protein
MELHLLYDDEEVVFYSTFTVSGVVLQKIPLYDTYFAVLTIDTAGARTLWLAQYASTTLLSFEKITDDTTLPEVPVFTFVDGALLWVLPGGEGMMGLDVVSKTQFGQTINPLPKDENILNLTSGSFDVTVVGETLEVERNIPSKTP